MSGVPAGLRELLRKATPGPWQSITLKGQAAHICKAFGGEAVVDFMEGETLTQTAADAALIVAAVNALPALIDVAEAADAYFYSMTKENYALLGEKLRALTCLQAAQPEQTEEETR